MLTIRLVVAILMALFAVLVVFNLPYPYLSPRWFFTSCGVAFMAAAFVGFIFPNKSKGG